MIEEKRGPYSLDWLHFDDVNWVASRLLHLDNAVSVATHTHKELHSFIGSEIINYIQLQILNLVWELKVARPNNEIWFGLPLKSLWDSASQIGTKTYLK